MEEELVTQTVELPGGALRIVQPRESAELPDSGEVKWAPLAPYWSVMWRSGAALAGELARVDLSGRRVVELGCGLGLPSLVAARAGAEVLATDAEAEPLELLASNGAANGITVETAVADWYWPESLLERAPFDLVLAADILYFEVAVDALLELLPRIAPEVWLADPGREDAEAFLERATERWSIETTDRGVVQIHRLRRR